MSIIKINNYKQGNTFGVHTCISKKKEMEIYEVYNSAYLIVAATCEMAYGMMVDAKDAIRKTPLFKHQVKYHINKALERYKKMQRLMLDDMNCKTKFWLDFMDGYDDMAEPFLQRIVLNFDRVIIEYKKENYGHEKALMLATVNILIVSCVTLKSFFIEQTKITGKNLSSLSPMRMIGDIRKEWTLAIDAIEFNGNIDLSKYKNCKKAVERLYRFIEDPKSINIPGDRALKLNPECDIRNYIKKSNEKLTRQ